MAGFDQVNSPTPTTSIAGTNALRSKASACTTMVEPMSAPSITAKAGASRISFRSAKLATSIAAADELCSAVATTTPLAQAVARLLVARAMSCRSRSPKARSMPVRTSRVDHSSSAMPPSNETSNDCPAISASLRTIQRAAARRGDSSRQH